GARVVSELCPRSRTSTQPIAEVRPELLSSRRAADGHPNVSHPLGSLPTMLLPPTCPGCGHVGAAPCPACVAALARAAPVRVPDGLDRCVALLGYEGVGRELVARIKYRNHRVVLRWVAARHAATVRHDEVDLVTCAPTTVERRRDRGFDHAEL